ncbi:MAG: hypothetical protein JSU59_02225 [Nitrospirota bacterium]|nr:MAG: hypothetical protein JSU59_02225 [Nitrospirota bacterium]
MPIVTKKKEMFVNFLVLMVSILSSFIIVEIICRYYYFGRISIQTTSPSGKFWKYDERLGWSPRPNSDGYFFNPANGIEAYVKFDENGIRENGNLDYSGSTASILVLGDSTTVGLEVDNDKTYVAVLERLLFESNCKVRVYNAGVRGYGTDQSYWRMQTLYDRIKPDHVLYMFSGNDFVNNRTIKKPRRVFGKPVFLLQGKKLQVFNRPAKRFEEAYFAYIKYDKNGKHSIIDGYAIEKVLGFESLKEVIRNNLALYHPLQTAYDMYSWTREQLERQTRLEKPKRSDKPEQLKKPQRLEKVREDIDLSVLKLILHKMKSVPGALFFTSFTKGRDLRSVEFRKLSNELGITYLDIGGFFVEESHKYDWKTDPHWNEKGHAQAAKGLYELFKGHLCAHSAKTP